MNVDQLYAILRSGDQDPRPALQWALDHWDEASDRLLSKLRATIAKLPDDPEEDAYAADAEVIFALLHLFAEKQDTRAYGPLCDRLLRDVAVSGWLGDAVDTTLHRIFISLYDGDISPLREIVVRAQGDEFVRMAALDAFVYLVLQGRGPSEEDARALLLELQQLGEFHESGDFWLVWTQSAARLGFADLSPEIARMLSKGQIPQSTFSMQEFHRMIGLARSDPAAMLAEADLGPFESTLVLYDLAAEADTFGDDDFGALRPHVNEMRDVGRNDPCRCGSGKKYKKCCLAA